MGPHEVIRAPSSGLLHSLVYSNKKEQPHARAKLASCFKENLRSWQRFPRQGLGQPPSGSPCVLCMLSWSTGLGC